MSALDKIHAALMGSSEPGARQDRWSRHLKLVAVVVALASLAVALGAVDTSRSMLHLLTSGVVARSAQ